MPDRLVNPDAAGRDAEDPFSVVYRSELVDGRVETQSWVLPSSAIVPGVPDAADPSPPARPRDKLHPQLRRSLQEPDLQRRLQLVVTFVDQPTMPRFPAPVPGEAPDSPRMQLERARAAALVRNIQEQRAPRYLELEELLRSAEPTIEFRNRFWLINAVLVEAPLRAVPRIADLAFVLSISPRFADDPPPADEIKAGRAMIDSDPYYAMTLPSSTHVALLDTGVRETHQLLVGRLGAGLDCVNGDNACAGAFAQPGDVAEHGTADAAILAAADASVLGLYRGVTDAVVDSMRVYSGPQTLDYAAVLKALECAHTMLQKVIVAEIQAGSDERSDIAVAADAAFETGAVVVAADGNNGDTLIAGGDGTVRSPACAHRVIGVGAYLLTTTGTYAQQSSGPTADGRSKPDVQGPTGSWSAGSTSDIATVQQGGTSGATPYIAGAAALLRDWDAALPGAPSDPGQVYAQLILFGDGVSPFDPRAGAGHLRLRLDGTSWMGKVAVGDGELVSVDLPVPAGSGKRFAAALWWPERWQDGDVHNTVTLCVVDPRQAVSPEASTPHSVFERRTLTSTATEGTWTVRIRGASVTQAPQTVYWAAFLARPAVVPVPQRIVALILRILVQLSRLVICVARRVLGTRQVSEVEPGSR